FCAADLSNETDLRKLLGLAGHYDITLQLENEPVCNVGNIAELAAFFRAADEASENTEVEEEEFEERPSDRTEPIYLRPLVDIANAWSTGERPTDSDTAVLAPLTTAIHV